MPLLEFQLKALQYSQAVDCSNAETTRKLVIWLENLKIREYRIGDRKALADVQSAGWDAAFQKYLRDLDCPVPPGEFQRAVEWLVAFALNLEYEDNADKLAGPSQPPTAAVATAAIGAGPRSGAAAPSTAAKAPGGPSGGDQAFSDLQHPRVEAAVLQLIRAVQGGPPGGTTSSAAAAAADVTGDETNLDVVAELREVAQRLVCQVGPALREGVWAQGQPAGQVLAGVPLGFEVEGEALSTAAVALRLLYIRDLRRLQSQIDHSLVEMQEYTANPKTDSSLGKVGR